MAAKAPTKKQTREDDAILTELRERYDYGTDEWRAIRAEAAIDMRYVAGDCWDPTEKAARLEKKRPVLEVDEVNQFLNQLVNDIRQNKRGIKVSPTGNGATDQSAAFRQGKIRDIEYRSNAQQAYSCMGESAFQQSFGFLRVKAQFVSDTTHRQELRVEAIVNALCVTPDPDHQKPDGTDLGFLFYEEEWTEKDFLRKFPDARVRSFPTEVRGKAPKWFSGSKVKIAEYWTKEPGTPRTLLCLTDGREVFEDTLPERPAAAIIQKERQVTGSTVMQYVTNGIEILERTKWPGQSIPFVTCYGKVMYLTEGGTVTKKILSLIRLARSPQMLYAYIRTKQAEIAKMIPLLPVAGYEGQFRGHEDEWARMADEAMGYVEFKGHTPETGEAQLLPPPSRVQYDAGSHLQALELLAEGARRAIQAAMGVSPLPTSAQRRNEKSGKALQQMEDSAQKGSFHFIDHYDESITRTGAILEELIPHYYGDAQETSIRQPNDDVAMVRINDPQALYSAKLTKHDGQSATTGHAPIDTAQGNHDVTLSVGPRESSEREANSDFADHIISQPELAQVVGPQKFAELIALSIKLKGIGPIGDQMAEIIAPKQDGQPDPRQVQQKMGQLQQELQQVSQAAQQMHQVIETKKVEAESREKIAAAQIDFQKWKVQQDNDAKITAAALSSKVDRLQMLMDGIQRLDAQNADAAKTAADHNHELDMNALDHQQALDAGQQGAQLAAAAADQGQAHALEAGQQAADLAPQPDAGGGA